MKWSTAGCVLGAGLVLSIAGCQSNTGLEQRVTALETKMAKVEQWIGLDVAWEAALKLQLEQVLTNHDDRICTLEKFHDGCPNPDPITLPTGPPGWPPQ